MSSIIGIFQALFIMGAAWWIYSYYSGRLKYSGEAEERRQERIKKYGVFLILSVVTCTLSGIILLFIKIIAFLNQFVF